MEVIFKNKQKQTMFLVQQLYFLHNVLPHLGEAGSGLLSAPQHQAVLVVACADAIQRLSHGLQGGKNNIPCSRWHGGECGNTET